MLHIDLDAVEATCTNGFAFHSFVIVLLQISYCATASMSTVVTLSCSVLRPWLEVVSRHSLASTLET